MSLRATIASAVDSAFSAIGDIPESTTYTVTSKAYDPDTGETATTETAYTVTAVFLRYELSEQDRQLVRVQDVKKCLIKTSELDIVPKLDDTITRYDGTVYKILGYGQDPTQSLWTFMLRSGA